MKASVLTKLANLDERLEELSALLGSPEVLGDQNHFRELSKEYAEITPVVEAYRAYRGVLETIESSTELARGADAEIAELAQEELEEAKTQRESLELRLQQLLIPKDPADEGNVFLEVRAGTGGDEAALFAGDLARMYMRYADSRGWKVEVMSQNEGEHGGFKEIIMRVAGKGAYSRLKFESGGHRVQRVPETESQGRIHTSACTVAVMPELEEIGDVEIKPADLRVDTFRASGAGGQHVNKTDSAIRITHLPTNTVVECQDERSQHKNRARAMSLLRARILSAQQEKQAAERADTRRELVGSGDRSGRIRTYNFPQGRVTEHRINLTLYKLDAVLTGELDHIINPMVSEYQADQLAALGDA